MAGMPRWGRDGQRDDTAEDAFEFAQIVGDYQREMRHGAVFPPLFAVCYQPMADLADLASTWLARLDGELSRWTWRPYYKIRNGRHRAAAAWRCGLRTFPSYVVGTPGEVWAAVAEHGTDEWLNPPVEQAQLSGHTGYERAWLEQTGPVRAVQQ